MAGSRTIPSPIVSIENETFWNAAKQGRFTVPTCAACGKAHWIPHASSERVFVLVWLAAEGRHGRNPKTRCHSGGGCRRIQPACWRGRGSHAGTAPCAQERPNRSYRRRA